MAATGKKAKKMKGKTMDIKNFLGDMAVGIQLQKQNWAEEEEDYGTGYSSRPRVPVVLPSASRASRGGGVFDDDSAPHYPPYMAYLSNLPYEVEDAAINDLFPDLKVIGIRLPRESEGRSKGFGYVEFEDRDSLVNAVNLHDLQLSGRRIRIDVAEAGDRKYGNRRSDRDRDREYDPERTAGDWRAGPRQDPEPGRKSEWSSSFRRDDRESDGGGGGGSSWRDARKDEPPRSYGGRDSFGRDRDDRGPPSDRSFSRDGERSERSYGFGRSDGDRDRGFGDRDRGGFGDRDRGGFGDRDRDRGGFGDRDRGYGDRDRDRGYGGYRGRDGGSSFGRGYGDRDRDDRGDAVPMTRPKLNLLPRTVPLPTAADQEKQDDGGKDSKDGSVTSSSGDDRKLTSPPSAESRPVKKPPVPASSIFGAAKPVDTSAREREIEERLMKKAEELKLRDGRSKDREEKWRDRKDDFGRDPPKRTDDRGSRVPYRGSRDSKEYPNSRDIRGDSREKRNSREYSDQDRDSRDTSRDNRESRDGRSSREGGREYSGSRDYRDNGDRDRRDRSYDERPKYPARDIKDEGPPKEEKKRERNHEERPMPKAKDHEPPNFIAPNKFCYLKNEDDDEEDAASE